MKHKLIIRGPEQITRLRELEIPIGHEVVIRPHRARRSLDQNALMWRWNEELGAHLGYDRHELEELHGWLCERYGGTEDVQMPDNTVRTRRLFHTSTANSAQMSNYLDWLARFSASEFGFIVSMAA